MLYIAEKPDVAKAIVNALDGDFKKNDGYFSNGDDVVTWCFGHLLELKQPQEHDEIYKGWIMETLPFAFYNYQRKEKDDAGAKKQLATIKKLIGEAKEIVHAGDPDDEGQLLGDEILRTVKNVKPVKRLLINDNNKSVIQKQLKDMPSNKDFEHLGWKAEARMIGDYHFGLNLTRAYSLLYRAKTGEKQTISAGRVQSAILGLIVRRDALNSSHKKSYFYTITGEFSFSGLFFKAKYQTKPTDLIDEKNRLLDETQAKEITNSCINSDATIKSIITSEKSVNPPLPYNLIKLQQDCAKKFDLDPSKTLEITQSLREKYQLITYNRSDCQYLSEEQHADAPEVLNAIKNNLNAGNIVDKGDAKLKGRVFDSSKVSAHHAIIPTATETDLSKLSSIEKKVYELIATAYLAQFYKAFTYEQTKVIIDCNNNTFGATSNKTLVNGWKELFNLDSESLDDEVFEDLQSLADSQTGKCENCSYSKDATKPLPLYTMPTLLADLTRVAKYIKDENLAKTLKDRDKDKEGENGGIGTPATRDSIINLLFARGYIEKVKKNIVSTDLGKDFYNQLSDVVRFPDTTALWAEKSENINNFDDVQNFIKYIIENITHEIKSIRSEYESIKPVKKELIFHDTVKCNLCGRDLVLREKNGSKFWSCVGFVDKENQCKNILSDVNGTPTVREKVAKKDKHYLYVKYEDKDEAKALGAKWDNTKKSWYITDDQDASLFEKFKPIIL